MAYAPVLQNLQSNEILAPLVREISWMHNIMIMPRAKTDEVWEFYLEEHDRDVRKPDENPSVWLILCAGKDNMVVEYALGRPCRPR